MRLGNRKGLGYSIDRPARRQEQNPAWPRFPHRFKQVYGAYEVVLNVGLWIEIGRSRQSGAEEMVHRVYARQGFDKRRPVRVVADMIVDTGQRSTKPLWLTVKNANGMPVRQ